MLIVFHLYKQSLLFLFFYSKVLFSICTSNTQGKWWKLAAMVRNVIDPSAPISIEAQQKAILPSKIDRGAQ